MIMSVYFTLCVRASFLWPLKTYRFCPKPFFFSPHLQNWTCGVWNFCNSEIWATINCSDTVSRSPPGLPFKHGVIVMTYHFCCSNNLACNPSDSLYKHTFWYWTNCIGKVGMNWVKNDYLNTLGWRCQILHMHPFHIFMPPFWSVMESTAPQPSRL